MSDSNTRNAPSCASNVAASTSFNASREAHLHLQIRAAHGIELLPRILGLLAQRALIPVAATVKRHHKWLQVDLEIDGLDDWDSERLVRRIEGLVSVMSVEWRFR